jgi:riboflavin biosynthesis pyrimidine reductase
LGWLFGWWPRDRRCSTFRHGSPNWTIVSVQSPLVEGGGAVSTSLFAAGLVDPFVVSVSLAIIGQRVEAVGDLRGPAVADGFRLANRPIRVTPAEVLLTWEVEPRA